MLELLHLLLLFSAALISLSSLTLSFDFFDLLLPFQDDFTYIVLELSADLNRQLIKLKTESITFLGIMARNDLEESLVLICLKLIDRIYHLLLSEDLLSIASWLLTCRLWSFLWHPGDGSRV